MFELSDFIKQSRSFNKVQSIFKKSNNWSAKVMSILKNQTIPKIEIIQDTIAEASQFPVQLSLLENLKSILKTYQSTYDI